MYFIFYYLVINVRQLQQIKKIVIVVFIVSMVKKNFDKFTQKMNISYFIYQVRPRVRLIVDFIYSDMIR